MLKLKNYSFSGIGRFVERQTINLENHGHLIQIDGENTNTGGSSGAGKSTTVEALAYLLGISDIPSTQLQSRITKSPIWVQGEFEGGITITRSKKEGLTIKTPEGTVSGNSKLAEEKLDEIIGVDRKLLKTMCYKRQKQGGFFLNLTPKESHEFLVKCLNLGEYQEKIKKLELNVKDKYKPRKIELNSSLIEVNSAIKELQTLLSQKQKPEKPEIINTTQQEIQIKVCEQKLKSEIEAHEQTIQSLGPKPVKNISIEFDPEKEQQLIDLKASVISIKHVIQENTLEKERRIEQATSAVYKARGYIDKANNAKQQAIEKTEVLKQKTEQYTHLKSGTCPTCMREWSGVNKTQEIEKEMFVLEKELVALKEEIAQIPHYMMVEEKAKEILSNYRNEEINIEENKTLLALEENIRKLQNEKDNLEKEELNKYLKESSAWQYTYNEAEKIFKAKEKELLDDISELKQLIERNKIQQDAYNKAIQSYETDILNINEKIESSQEKLNKQNEELIEIEKNITLSEESIRLIKNYTLQKFQDTLDHIGNRATEIISMIPNMSNAFITFESAKEAKNGKIKNEVNAVINLEGDAKIPIKTLSGGERTSADLAIDLAVGEVIENSTQKGVNFLIIDEGFDGLDSVSKIECLEILKSLNTNKKIIMVDHSSEVKEMVSDIIKVKRTNEESVIYE